MRLLLSWLLCFSLAVTAEATEWQQYKTVDATSVEYRYNADKLLEVRAQTEASSTTAAFLHLLEDTANISKWAANTEKAQLLGQPDANTHIVHTYFTAIWPVSKRDMVTQSVWQQDAGSGVLTMQVSDLGEHYPKVKGYVRMQSVQGLWTLTPLPDGLLRIQYQGRADAAGKLPRFIGDKVALNALFKTFVQLRTMLKNYQQPYPGVVE
ncbi:START domain-containing protein [Rheinheimera sp.]|uniref:START domain-containing protein n=1 Tax=Rheinheimera sp. TaxID=1869214 RepID=UPI00273288F5|nr:START domain-containing protein [Rheinheimera sp.]MDP2716802.1 START domain-containing protein [Rheinheimera sp.]